MTIPNKWSVWLQQKNDLELHCSKALMRVLAVGHERAAHMRTTRDPYQELIDKRIRRQVLNRMRSDEEDSISSSEQEYQREEYSISSTEETYQHDAGRKRDRDEEGDDKSLREKKAQRLIQEYINIGEQIAELTKGAEKRYDVKEMRMMWKIEAFHGKRQNLHICKLYGAGFRFMLEK